MTEQVRREKMAAEVAVTRVSPEKDAMQAMVSR